MLIKDPESLLTIGVYIMKKIMYNANIEICYIRNV